MQCSRCQHPVNADGKAVCTQCGSKLTGKATMVSDRAISDYHRSPIKRGVRQGLLIIVFVFLFAALIQVLTNDLQLPKYSGDVIAVLGLIAGIARCLQITVFSKKI